MKYLKTYQLFENITNNINEYDFENNTLNGFYEKYIEIMSVIFI